MRFVLFQRETYEFWIVPEQVTHLVKDSERAGTTIHLTGDKAVLVDEPIKDVATKLASRG